MNTSDANKLAPENIRKLQVAGIEKALVEYKQECKTIQQKAENRIVASDRNPEFKAQILSEEKANLEKAYTIFTEKLQKCTAEYFRQLEHYYKNLENDTLQSLEQQLQQE